MNAFAYVTARTPESAVAAVRSDGRFLAGGIDLLGEMKESLATPKTLVNIKALPGTTEIRSEGGKWRVGANVTLAALAQHTEMRRLFPGLVEAAGEVGSPQIRHVATVGGNLAQHSRCWYYRHRDVTCRKKGGTTCLAREGESKYHSLFTGCMCISPVCSNLAIALAALDARVGVHRGRRVEALTVAQLFESAWKTPTDHHSLRPEDLILHVELGAPAGSRSAYLQLSEKADFDWALVSCAAAGTVDRGTLRGIRVVLGSVAPIPWMVDEANAYLNGKPLTAEHADRAAELILKDARPFTGNAYKVPLARALIRRTLLKLAA
jgi:xanthine dehydrogenase YagS FAD-binding subunit